MKLYLFIAILFAIGLSSCKHSSSDDHGHSHDTKVQLTGYNEDFEIFAEIDPFVKGKNSKALVHVTSLRDFKPLNDSSSVTINLIVGTKGIRQTTNQALKPGIYSFELQPEVEGTGKLVFEIQKGGESSRVVIDNQHVYTDEHMADEEAKKVLVENPNAIIFGKEQSWKVDFSTEMPELQPFGDVIKTTALVQSAQGDEQIIVARTSGIVLLSNNNVYEGNAVSSGQQLFTLSSSGLADNSVGVRLAEAQNNFLRSKSEYERSLELAKEKIVSDKDLMQTKSEYETAKAVYDNLYKNFSSNGQQVKSSMNGYIKQLFVNNGQYVAEGDPLVSISQNKTLMLKADIQQKYLSILPYVVTANIRNANGTLIYTLDELNGKLLSYGRSVNLDNYLIPVLFQIDNKADFVPGSFVELFIRTKTNDNALVIPNAALMEEQGNYFVFVQQTPEMFDKREVKIGATDGIRTEIVSGLSSQDRIVSKGAISVKLAQSSGALDPHAGHAH